MKTLYSLLEQLALAYWRWKRPAREEIVEEAGRDSKPGARAEREPVLPNGYVHIRSAIQALMGAGRRIGWTPAKATVHCAGRITSDTAQSLGTTVKRLFSASDTVELDLTKVSYIDASGLGAIVSLGAAAKAANCRLKLINLNRRLKESLGMARLNEVLADAAFWRMGFPNDYLNSRQSTPDSGSSE
jgi:anti-anti-sigma factor